MATPLKAIHAKRIKCSESRKRIQGGLKFDQEKDRWDLLPWDILEDVVKILTYGSKKYSADNWKKVEPYRERYFAAVMRHLSAWRQGELLNDETNISHIAHAICNLMFIAWKDKRNKKICRKAKYHYFT